MCGGRGQEGWNHIFYCNSNHQNGLSKVREMTITVIRKDQLMTSHSLFLALHLEKQPTGF